MVWSWLRKFQRRKPTSADDPVAWREAVDALPAFAALTKNDQKKLLKLAHEFADDKSWEGCGELILTEIMRASISIQACLLILNLNHRLYRRVRTILVYPTAYVAESGSVPRAGEAWLGGPVILSWAEAFQGGKDPSDGRNTVLHEFAHKLDMLDGQADGVPPLTEREHYEVWNRIVGGEYESLVRRTESGRATLLDSYGATNPAEFFAVATECFFEQPRKLLARHAELYALLRTLYNQDPASRSKKTRKLGRRRGRF